MKIGDKVRIVDDTRAIFLGLGSAIGEITEILDTWEEDDIICWDVHVEFPGRILKGFHFKDLTVVKD